MQDLDAEIPPNSYSSITPYGVNDAGQILVDLYDSGATHWGTLVPSGVGQTPSPAVHRFMQEALPGSGPGRFLP